MCAAEPEQHTTGDTMYERIILATDGSKNAQKATESAIGLVKELKCASVTIIHVMQAVTPEEEIAKAVFDVCGRIDENVRPAIQTTIDRVEQEGISYRLEISLGDPASEIVAHAKKEGAGLIVIGSRGLNGVKGALLGSVGQKVMQLAHCPVMIVT
ncbi:MAG: hypothetical protein PWP08_367 [Methanofollis sp.]|nr:hypothetical protein [Methanofollis sp.]